MDSETSSEGCKGNVVVMIPDASGLGGNLHKDSLDTVGGGIATAFLVFHDIMVVCIVTRPLHNKLRYKVEWRVVQLTGCCCC
jgi:hypothetical protein